MLGVWSYGLKVWVDMTASAHVLVFRPLIQLLRERGDEVEITAREYAQTLQLLELHRLEATVVGRHGGRSRGGEGRFPAARPGAPRIRAPPPGFSLRPANGVHQLTITGPGTRNPEATAPHFKVAL